MDQTREGLEISVAIIAMLIVILFSIAVILFFIIYQRRLLEQHKAKQQMESEYQRELLKTSIDIQEVERNRIARELHDDVGAMLTTTKLYFKQVSSDLAPNELDKITIKMNGLLESMIESTRSISQNLSPIVLNKLGLIEAINSLSETINDSGEMSFKFENNLSVRLDKSRELNIYRIVQELIANTLKHAQASEIRLNIIEENNQLILMYSDNGTGFKSENVKSKKGIGLKNIESRLSVMKGKIQYDHKKTGLHVRIEMELSY